MSTEQKKVRKINWRMIMVNTMAALGAIALFSLLGFANRNQKNVFCRHLNVSLVNPVDHNFVSAERIKKQIQAEFDSLEGTPIENIRVSEIHRLVASMGEIREAHVFTTVDGECIVEVKQRIPVARIINADGRSFYLDTEGFAMPLSDQYSADVPLFTGELSESLTTKSVSEMVADSAFTSKSLLDDIMHIAGYLRSNDFWNAQVEHINVRNREFEIVPRVGNHRIVLGDSSDLDEKFRKLMAFYVKVLPVRDINIYKTINLKYEGQVVCEERLAYQALTH